MGRTFINYQHQSLEENEVWIMVAFYFITLAADKIYPNDESVQIMIKDWRPDPMMVLLQGVLKLERYLTDDHRLKAFYILLDEAEKEAKKFESAGIPSAYLRENLKVSKDVLIWGEGPPLEVKRPLEILGKIRDLLDGKGKRYE